jgi:hypothetical protein
VHWLDQPLAQSMQIGSVRSFLRLFPASQLFINPIFGPLYFSALFVDWEMGDAHYSRKLLCASFAHGSQLKDSLVGGIVQRLCEFHKLR